jgi:hypothetical protein
VSEQSLVLEEFSERFSILYIDFATLGLGSEIMGIEFPNLDVPNS